MFELSETVSFTIFNTNNTPNKLKIDSLKNQYQHLINYLDSNIETLNVIAETDKQLNLKGKWINYLKKTKGVYSNRFTETLELLNNKKGSITEDQNKSTKIIRKKMEEDLDVYFKNVMRSVQEYQRKYNITDEDLKQYGFKMNLR